jgi:hypothetical protein
LDTPDSIDKPLPTLPDAAATSETSKGVILFVPIAVMLAVVGVLAFFLLRRLG